MERAGHRSLLFATGITRKELDMPMIGVATSFTDLIPGHIGMRDLERFIEKGVHTGGGWPLFFGFPASATASPWATRACTTRCHRAN